MPLVFLSPIGGAGAQFFDNNGVPLAGGKLYTYDAGTTTPRVTYTTIAGDVAHSNPIVLDAAGRVPSGGEVWLLQGVYTKVVLTNSAGAALATWDNLSGVNDSVSQINTALSTLAASGGSALVGFVSGNTGTPRTVESKLRESVSVKDFDAKGDGTTDDTVAFTAAIAAAMASGSSVVHVPTGQYCIAAGTVFDALTSLIIRGDGMGSSILKITGSGNIYIKAPTDVTFEDLGWQGVAQNGIYQTVWATGFTRLKFCRCRFTGFGGGTLNNSGSCALVLAARDTASSVDAAGDSIDATLLSCEFDGNSRMTNFGVRVNTSWAPVGTAQCRDVKVLNCHFEGYNWNACEIAGPNTCNAVVTGCTAYACGLVPFDLDKGCHDCVVSNVTIDRLLGNIDTDVNPNTRATVVSVSGVAAAGPYCYNNVVSDVTARLLASDIGAYNGYGVAAVGITYAQNSIVRGINVECDVIPNRANSNSPFAFAAVEVASISGCTVQGVTTVNATAGIIETEAKNSGVGYEWNMFDSIRNIGMMTGHAVSMTYGGAAYFRYRFSRLLFASTLSDCRPTLADKSLVKLAATSVGVSAMAFEDCGFYSATTGIWGVQFGTPRLSMHNVNFDIPAQANIIKSGGSGAYLHLGLCMFQGAAVDVSTVLAAVSATCVIYQGFIPHDNGQGHYGAAATYGQNVPWHSTTAPTNPPVAYFSSGARVNYFAPTAGGYLGLVATAGGWKTYGAISV